MPKNYDLYYTNPFSDNFVCIFFKLAKSTVRLAEDIHTDDPAQFIYYMDKQLRKHKRITQTIAEQIFNEAKKLYGVGDAESRRRHKAGHERIRPTDCIRVADWGTEKSKRLLIRPL